MSDAPKVNLLAPISSTDPNWQRRRVWRGVFFGMVLGIAALFTTTRAAPTASLTPLLQELAPPLIANSVGKLLLASNRTLIGENQDRINILLTGIGGEGHDGAQLTDTILLLSYKPSTQQVAFLSIPRDLLVSVPGYGWQKVNAVNALAERDDAGSGGEKTSQVIGELLGQSIPYYIRIDFRGFEKVIDALGGVDVTVDRSFTDAAYPTADDLYQTVSFRAGAQHMNGATSLIFARSRHGNNFEGNDFARNARQQKILVAVKEKLLSSGTLANPATIIDFTNILASHVSTNISFLEFTALARAAQHIDTTNVLHTALSAEPNGLLKEGIINSAYVLVPQDSTYGTIHERVEQMFAVGVPSAPSTTPVATTPQVQKTAPTSSTPAVKPRIRVTIQNGTTRTGYAAQIAAMLTKKGYIVIRIENAEKRGYSTSLVSPVSNTDTTEAQKLATLVHGTVADTPPTTFNSAGARAQKIDLLLILGEESFSLVTPS